MKTLEALKLTDSQLNKLAKKAKNEGITLNDAIEIYTTIKVNYRMPFDLTSLKSATFETMNDANSFKKTMEAENYIVFKPHYAVI